MHKLLWIVGFVVVLAASGGTAYQYCCGLPMCPEPSACPVGGK